METKLRKHKFIITSIIALICIFVVCILFTLLDKANDKNTLINTNWEITYGGQTYKDADISNFNFNNIKYNDIVYLKHDLKSVKQYDEPLMSFITCRSSIEVFVGEKKVYSENMSHLKGNHFMGAGYNRVSLKKSDYNKNIVFKVYSNANNPFTHFMPVLVGDARTIYTGFIISNIMYVIACVIAVAVGLICIVIGIVLIKKYHDFYEILYTGIFSFVCGVWIACASKILQIFTPGFNIHSLIEFIFLYSIPFWNGWVYYHLFKTNKKNITGFKHICILNACFLMITSIAQIFNIFHYQHVLLLFHVIMSIELLYVFVLLFKLKSDLSASFRETIINGMILLSIFTIFDILRYNVVKLFNSYTLVSNILFMPYGVIIYLSHLGIAYSTLLKEKLYSIKEKNKLSTLAYTDFLTNLYNRNKCEQILDELDSVDYEYYIVSIDLNGLKKINDTKGHSYGDFLLKSFSKELKDYFCKYGDVGRMGGDEFVIFIRETNIKINILKLLTTFSEKIDAINKKTYALDMSFAYGYEKKSQKNTYTSRHIYEIADEKMYVMKKQIKMMN